MKRARNAALVSEIGLALLHEREILRLRTRPLVRDVQARYGCDTHTALAAVDLARRNAPDVHPLEANPCDA